MMAPTQPNVVILYADDLGWGDLGCFGAADLDTPALDALAADGVRLPEWYSNSPVCSPSRASLLTGRHPAHAGVEAILGGSRRTPGLPPQPTLASELRDRGYATGIFGKWHLGAEASYGPLHRGFDHHFGFRAGCVDYYSHIFYWGNHTPLHDLWEDEQEVWRNGEYLTTVIADRAADFIERNADRPFFCYVPFNAPHYPMHAPAEYMDAFAHLPLDRQQTAAMIKAMDNGVGHILQTLERLGLKENTLVFFSSDNGPSVEERNWLNGEEVSYTGGSAGGLRGHKGSLFEGGIRVPGIISWPAQLPAGTELTGPAAMTDVVPTVLEAVDGHSPTQTDLDGRSVLTRLRQAAPARRPGTTGPGGAPDADPDRWFFWEYDGQLAARHGRWKLLLGARESMAAPVVVGEGLFDLASDPGEQHDLAGVHPERVAQLRPRLLEWAATCTRWREVTSFS